ncbi:MAG TPA: plastocyanin/azurin family copper-binding protein [Thermoleophilaceae bacterium]
MRRLAKRSTLAFVVAAIAALALVQLALGAAGPRASSTTDQVRGKEFSFKLSTRSSRRPGKVRFTFRNVGTVQHDFRINGKQTPLIRPGKSASIVVNFKKPGTYRYICTVPGHAAAGMRGVFTVR